MLEIHMLRSYRNDPRNSRGNYAAQVLGFAPLRQATNMATQTNPLLDDALVDFLLYSVLDAEGLCELDAYSQHSKETFDLYIDAFGQHESPAEVLKGLVLPPAFRLRLVK